MVTIERFRTSLEIEKYQPMKPQKQIAREETDRMRYIGILSEDRERYLAILEENRLILDESL
jgi:hypothetical protein